LASNFHDSVVAKTVEIVGLLRTKRWTFLGHSV